MRVDLFYIQSTMILKNNSQRVDLSETFSNMYGDPCWTLKYKHVKQNSEAVVSFVLFGVASAFACVVSKDDTMVSWQPMFFFDVTVFCYVVRIVVGKNK